MTEEAKLKAEIDQVKVALTTNGYPESMFAIPMKKDKNQNGDKK